MKTKTNLPTSSCLHFTPASFTSNCFHLNATKNRFHALVYRTIEEWTRTTHSHNPLGRLGDASQENESFRVFAGERLTAEKPLTRLWWKCVSILITLPFKSAMKNGASDLRKRSGLRWRRTWTELFSKTYCISQNKSSHFQRQPYYCTTNSCGLSPILCRGRSR